jgi:hypothetical protein
VFTYLELGHSVHTVFDGIQTEPGHLFFATDGGLVEFNASSYQVITAQNSNLPSNNLRCISEDHSGNLWIGTGSSGLAIFSPEGSLSVTDHSQRIKLFTPYPNPTTENVTLDLSADINSDFDILIHNATGQLVMRKRINAYGSGVYNLDLSTLNPGALSVTVVSDRYTDTQHLLKL